jgi:UDP-N-acetylmuramoyl-tripeptide--D-alanyl-D-alanine ligase
MRTLLKKIIAGILRVEARLILLKYKPNIIAITGSVGKTSTKDAIYEVVAAHAHARKSEKSFNSEIGLPLTVLGRPNAWSNPIGWIENIFDGILLFVLRSRYPEWLILEVGADRPGDISSLASWLPLDVAVITRLPDVPVHVEFFESPEAVKEEKASIINALKPGGALVLYADDVNMMMLRERAPEAKVITFGFSKGADVWAHKVEILSDEKTGRLVGMRARIQLDGEEGMLEVVGAIGAHALLPALAAIAVGRALGGSFSDSLLALKYYDPPRGRMRLVDGEKGACIIDDTYNSSPAAVEAALDTFALLPGRRRIAVLGDMLELGRHSVDEHRKAGALAAKCTDLLATVGFRARDIAQGALDNGMKDECILQFESAEVAGKELEPLIQAGDVILIKGSQSMRMERIVEEIMQDPAHAADMLVRQDEEWKKKL